MRYIYLLVFLLGTLTSQGQNLPRSGSEAAQMARSASTEQLSSYVSKAKAEGYSLLEVKNIIRAQGASTSDLALLEELWNTTTITTERITENTEDFSSNFGMFVGQGEGMEKIEEKGATRFGENYFSYAKPLETPELYLATPADYQLGPGDEILVELYGASEESYPLQISRQGTIKVERLAPVYLSGLSIASAQRRLEARFSEIYTGLKASSNDPSKVTLSLSLQKARSVVVNITGQVKAPGTYTLSGFSSPLNALYAAGGPNEVGSYRKVRLLRGGKLFQEIDLYDFFVRGKLPMLYLQDQDVIQVPSFQAQVELSGAFKTQGFFELKDRETLLDVLDFSGGFLSDAYKDRVFVNRVSGFKRTSFTLETESASSEVLVDGDIITANIIREDLENAVIIEGEVYVPGTYSLTSVSSIKELIEVSNGLTQDALTSRAILYRREQGVERQALSIDLDNSDYFDLTLKSGDRLFIPSVIELTDLGTIQVQGEANNPGIFEFKDGMRLSDALIQAEGLTAKANGYEITVYHSDIDRNTSGFVSVVSVDDQLNPSDNVTLAQNDLVVVRENSVYRPIEQVRLEGYVINKGTYALKGSDYRLYDLLVDAGGFLEEAYLPGISITRKISGDGTNSEAVEKAIQSGLESINDSITGTDDALAASLASKYLDDTIIIGIDGASLMESKGTDLKNNLVLQQGDVITVPKLDNTVTIVGSVQQASKVAYRSGLTVSRALRSAGGYSDKARKSKVYVVYQNGSIKSRGTFGFGLLRFDPQLEPGATIVVPDQLQKPNPLTFGDVVGVTTSLTTLALLISRLGL